MAHTLAPTGGFRRRHEARDADVTGNRPDRPHSLRVSGDARFAADSGAGGAALGRGPSGHRAAARRTDGVRVSLQEQGGCLPTVLTRVTRASVGCGARGIYRMRRGPLRCADLSGRELLNMRSIRIVTSSAVLAAVLLLSASSIHAQTPQTKEV